MVYHRFMKDPLAPGPRDFATTHWSLVLATQPDGAGESHARQALAALCGIYWYPLYAFVRFRGYDPEQAQDLTQAFFVRLVETAGLAGVDPERGRFRSYLLGAMKHFLANAWDREQTKKRGGEIRFVDLDALDPEARYALAPAQTDDPDAAFDREWAMAILDRALQRLHEESESKGRGQLFAELKGSLTGSEPDRSKVAERLGVTEGAIKVTVHRLRKRFRTFIRAEIAETVADPGDIDEEMRYLVEILRKT